jgi:hypothetical protein
MSTLAEQVQLQRANAKTRRQLAQMGRLGLRVVMERILDSADLEMKIVVEDAKFTLEGE